MAAREAVEVTRFWREAGPERWFARDEAFDEEIRRRFAPLVERAAAGELADWEAEPEGALALLILTDQFPRNLHRGKAAAYAADALARRIADRAIAAGHDQAVEPELRAFFYLPFMHSEELADQQRCVALFEALKDENGLRYAILHRDLIKRFGRFPHRNEALGRKMTPDEAEFLEADGSSKNW